MSLRFCFSKVKTENPFLRDFKLSQVCCQGREEKKSLQMQGSDADVEAASDVQVDLENGWPISDVKVSGRSKSSNLSIEIPIGPAPCYADSCIGKAILHCHSLRVKINSSIFDRGGGGGRRSFCLSSHSTAPPDSPTKNRQSSVAELCWRECKSLPATPTAPSRPSIYISAPGSERRPSTQKDQQLLVDPSKDPKFPTIVIDSGHDRKFSEDDEAGICRICLDTMREGIKMKMACSCKGDLRLVHEACAVSWFRTKGNKICEICDQEVTNLPVIEFREDSPVKTEEETEDLDTQNWAMNEKSSVQEFLCLVLMSTIGYFVVLELLLVQEKTSRGLSIAAPFAFGLGILASIFAVILGVKEQVWKYAVLEFALVSVIIHLSSIMLNVEPVYSIMLGSVIGMVFAMGINILARHCTTPTHNDI
ncbi:unnamed protein product [Linum trigynum]|uniref:RING-CH-type domain-containing protein n=1 Tax=Linum trigynum TaxID=586398 RepID=A0AAV2FFL8_9ROSI